MKNVPLDRIDPHGGNQEDPAYSDDTKYYCKWCYRTEEDHEPDEICDEQCNKSYEADDNNPVEPPERDPDNMPGGVDDY